MKRAVISLSGGMDSTGLLVHLLAKGYEVFALSFFYQQKHSVELTRAKTNIGYLRSLDQPVHHEIIDLSQAMESFSSALTDRSVDVPEGHYEQENMKATVVPNRNAIFSSLTYGYALSLAERSEGRIQLALGVHSGDHAIYPDCRPEFYEALDKAFRLGNWESDRINFYLPFLHGDKLTILQDAEQSIKELHGIDFDEIFKNTNTSYNPDERGRSSGRSGADVERILAFHELGRKDPVEYVKPWEEVLADALKIKEEHEAVSGGS